MVKIRLQRRGRRKKPFYHIVIADARSPRDGRFIEKVGTYNPMTKPATIDLDRDLAFDWLLKGAQPTDTVRAILRNKGVMYRKHLHRGVLKGALSQEKADELYEGYVSKKDAAYAERVAETRKEEDEARKAVAGVAPPPPPPPVDFTVIQPDQPAEGEAEAPASDPAADALAEARGESTADQTTDSGDTEREAPDAKTPEAAAPGDLPEEVADAKAPAAEIAEAEGSAGGDPAVQSAVDVAANNAEGSPSEATSAPAEEPAEEAEKTA